MVQAKIDELQRKRREEVKEKGRKEVVELEEKLEKMEEEVEKVRREEEVMKKELRKQEKENRELKGKVKDCEVTIIEVIIRKDIFFEKLYLYIFAFDNLAFFFVLKKCTFFIIRYCLFILKHPKKNFPLLFQNILLFKG